MCDYDNLDYGQAREMFSAEIDKEIAEAVAEALATPKQITFNPPV